MRSVLLFTCVLLFPVAIGAQSGGTSTDAPALADYAWGFPINVSEDASFYSVELPLAVNQSVTDPALRDAGVFNSDGSPVSRVFEQADSDRESVERSNPLPMLPLYEAADTRTDENGLSLEREGDSMQFKFDLEDLLAPDEDEQLIA